MGHPPSHLGHAIHAGILIKIFHIGLTPGPQGQPGGNQHHIREVNGFVHGTFSFPKQQPGSDIFCTLYHIAIVYWIDYTLSPFSLSIKNISPQGRPPCKQATVLGMQESYNKSLMFAGAEGTPCWTFYFQSIFPTASPNVLPIVKIVSTMSPPK